MNLAGVALVVCDVDGVLTDGKLHYGPDGESLKSFSVRDGLGISRLQAAGVKIAAISGRRSAALEARLDDLGVALRNLGCGDKGAAFDQLLAELGIDASATLAVGDDVIDAPMLDRAGIAVAVADAHPDLRARADWVTAAAGGAGAVREIADAILAARDRRDLAFRVVIPSRYGSSRLPGKPLREIAGKPMIAHVLDRAAEAGAAEVLVATDDERIASVVTGLGAEAVLTDPDHTSGTDRIAEVAARRGWSAGDIVVNLQGDEPGLPGEHVRAVAASLAANPWASIATLATPIVEPGRADDPNCVKVVVASSGKALLFSRAPIPHNAARYLRHIGLYAYRVGVLARLAASPAPDIEKRESLEQLRALDLGLDIHVTIVTKAPPDGVDTESDLERIERYLRP